MENHKKYLLFVSAPTKFQIVSNDLKISKAESQSSSIKVEYWKFSDDFIVAKSKDGIHVIPPSVVRLRRLPESYLNKEPKSRTQKKKRPKRSRTFQTESFEQIKLRRSSRLCQTTPEIDAEIKKKSGRTRKLSLKDVADASDYENVITINFAHELIMNKQSNNTSEENHTKKHKRRQIISPYPNKTNVFAKNSNESSANPSKGNNQSANAQKEQDPSSSTEISIESNKINNGETENKNLDVFCNNPTEVSSSFQNGFARTDAEIVIVDELVALETRDQRRKISNGVQFPTEQNTTQFSNQSLYFSAQAQNEVSDEHFKGQSKNGGVQTTNDVFNHAQEAKIMESDYLTVQNSLFLTNKKTDKQVENKLSQRGKRFPILPGQHDLIQNSYSKSKSEMSRSEKSSSFHSFDDSSSFSDCSFASFSTNDGSSVAILENPKPERFHDSLEMAPVNSRCSFEKRIFRGHQNTEFSLANVPTNFENANEIPSAFSNPRQNITTRSSPAPSSHPLNYFEIPGHMSFNQASNVYPSHLNGRLVQPQFNVGGIFKKPSVKNNGNFHQRASINFDEQLKTPAQKQKEQNQHNKSPSNYLMTNQRAGGVVNEISSKGLKVPSTNPLSLSSADIQELQPHENSSLWPFNYLAHPAFSTCQNFWLNQMALNSQYSAAFAAQNLSFGSNTPNFNSHQMAPSSLNQQDQNSRSRGTNEQNAAVEKIRKKFNSKSHFVHNGLTIQQSCQTSTNFSNHPETSFSCLQNDLMPTSPSTLTHSANPHQNRLQTWSSSSHPNGNNFQNPPLESSGCQGNENTYNVLNFWRNVPKNLSLYSNATTETPNQLNMIHGLRVQNDESQSQERWTGTSWSKGDEEARDFSKGIFNGNGNSLRESSWQFQHPHSNPDENSNSSSSDEKTDTDLFIDVEGEDKDDDEIDD